MNHQHKNPTGGRQQNQQQQQQQQRQSLCFEQELENNKNMKGRTKKIKKKLDNLRMKLKIYDN